VTKFLIDGAEVFSSAFSGYMVYNAVDEVVIEITPLETR
jgi:hypothetical protein